MEFESTAQRDEFLLAHGIVSRAELDQLKRDEKQWEETARAQHCRIGKITLKG